MYNNEYDISEETDNKLMTYTNHNIQLRFEHELEDVIKDVSDRGIIYRKDSSNEIKKLILCLISLTELERWNMGFHIDSLQTEIDDSSLFDDEYKRDPRELGLYYELFPETRPVKVRKNL